jgi:hypothetical protein
MEKPGKNLTDFLLQGIFDHPHSRRLHQGYRSYEPLKPGHIKCEFYQKQKKASAKKVLLFFNAGL